MMRQLLVALAGRSQTRRTPQRGARRGSRSQVPADLQAFFDRFTTCLTSGDGDGVAACFEYPTLMVMSDAKYGPNQPFDRGDTASAFFAKDAEMYRQRGIWGTFADVRDVQWLTPDLCLVNVHFPYIDADGNDMGDGESSLYIVRRTAGGYAIASIVTLGTESDHAGPQPAGGWRSKQVRRNA